MKYKHGDLVVWHIPQVPMKPFKVPVHSVAEAKIVLDTLAQYDTFQYDNNVKGDYANAQGLSIWDENLDPDERTGEQFCDWESADNQEIRELSYDECLTARYIGDAVMREEK